MLFFSFVIKILTLARESVVCLIPSHLLDSIVKSGHKDTSIARHREENGWDGITEGGEATGIVTPWKEGDMLALVGSNLNNDFEHQCLELAVRKLGAEMLEPRDGDIGNRVLRIPGIPNGRFLPHQIWGIWFLVDRIITDAPPVALLADDMGMGKTFTALGTVLHLKWIASEADAGRRLACLDNHRVQDLDNIPSFFGAERDVYHRPSIVMVPANLMGTWEDAITKLLPGTGCRLVNLNSDRSLTSVDLNYVPGNTNSGLAIHLVSYPTYRSRYRESLAGCCWGIGIFDESHTVCSRHIMLYRALRRIDVRGKIQLTGTPMYHDVNSWVVQTEWLFANVEDEAVLEVQGPQALRNVIADAKKGHLTMEAAYDALKAISYPWLIRRWADSKNGDGEPLVDLAKHVFHDVRLEYTNTELDDINAHILEIRDERRGQVATVIHEWRLACLSMDLPGNDMVAVGGQTHYRQEWDLEVYLSGPAVRWLGEIMVPILLGEPAQGKPNKVVIFTPLPGQAWYVHWYLSTLHPEVNTMIYHSAMDRPAREQLLRDFADAEEPSALVLTPALGGTGLNLVAANHVVILQKFWVLNEQRQAIGRIVRLGQQRTPTAWVVHCAGSVDDRAQELHESRAIYEARIMHGLIGESFSYQDLLNARDARIRDMEEEQIAPNASRTRSPAGTPPYKSPTPGPAPQEQTPMSVG